MAKVVRYYTSTGAVVTFTPDDGEMPRWECDACGEMDDGLSLRPAHAQAHATRCTALPD